MTGLIEIAAGLGIVLIAVVIIFALVMLGIFIIAFREVIRMVDEIHDDF